MLNEWHCLLSSKTGEKNNNLLGIADYRKVCINMQMSRVKESTVGFTEELGLYLEHETREDIKMQHQHLSTPAEGEGLEQGRRIATCWPFSCLVKG